MASKIVRFNNAGLFLWGKEEENVRRVIAAKSARKMILPVGIYSNQLRRPLAQNNF